MLIPLGDNLERPNFPTVTVALILFNVLIFACTYRAGLTAETVEPAVDYESRQRMAEVEAFYDTWGLTPNKLSQGQIIGVLTSVFLHGSILHLIGNMIILWAFGQSLETSLGPIPFAVLYVLWGALAGIAQCATNFSSEIPLIGASGAIAGVIGAYVMLLGYSANIKLLFLLGLLPFRFQIPAIYVGCGWFFMQLMNGSMDVTGEMSGVAWMAHIGGFLVGLVTVAIFRNQTDRILVKRNDMLVFKRRDEQIADNHTPAITPQHIHAQPEVQPVEFQAMKCHGCETQLTEDNLIGDLLLRCPNCNQLCYLEQQPA